MTQDVSGWQTAMASAAANALAVRWHTITENLLIARAEYLSLLEAEPTDVERLREAAQRLYDLQQQNSVLMRELQKEP
jgi:hypothetical protein